MFEKALKQKFETIFQLEHVRYDAPAGADEQDVLFVEIEKCKSSVRDTKADGRMIIGRVQGKGTVFSQLEKMPYAFLTKAIASHPTETKDMFFFDLEENKGIYRNIVQRTFSFIYFFSGQYDPDLGTITSITITETLT